MIAAIGFRFKKNCQAKIYPVGTYDQINWSEERSCELGKEYSTFVFKHPDSRSNTMIIESGLDDEMILRLIETKRYMLKVECEEGERLALPHFQNEGNKFLKCDRDRDLISFQFVNYLGRSKIVFGKDDDVCCLPFEVIPDKISYEDDYIGLTEALAQVCSELLLDYAGATSNLFSQAEDTAQTFLEQFIFLRQFCYSENIQSLFEAIKRKPDRVLVHEEEFKPCGYGVPSKKFYSNPFSYSKGWKKIGSAREGAWSYWPQEIAVTKKTDSLDTPANRFIKYALQKFHYICMKLMNALSKSGEMKQAECLKEAEAIHTMLNTILRDHFFDEIGTLDSMPQNNQVLQKREGYSQIFSAYSMIDLALKLNWKGKDAVYEGESKNVALLYEYWLFFELYRIIKSMEGCETVEAKETPFLIANSDGIHISLEQGQKSCQSFIIKRLNTKINLYYNRKFSNAEFRTTKYEGSYSRPFRPDYTIAIYPDSFSKDGYHGEGEAVKNGAVSYIHFDAKYRITDLTALIGKNEVSEDDETEILEDKIGSVINTYKRGDLLKMHTYNDAIRRTIGSYVLYPGSCDLSGKGHKTFHLYDEILPGVGAFAIKPSTDMQGEAELRRFITTLAESKEKHNSRLNRMKYYAEMILREPAIMQLDVRENGSVLDQQDIKAVPNGIKGRMCVLGYIRADSDDDYYFSLKQESLLKQGARFLFYFYAIKGSFVYTHHKDIPKATDFRFYTNQIRKTGDYRLEPILCKIESHELLSRAELVRRLHDQGYNTEEKNHQADFYYVLSVLVVDDHYPSDEIRISDINEQNGNDTFSPHSPKIICY